MPVQSSVHLVDPELVEGLAPFPLLPHAPDKLPAFRRLTYEVCSQLLGHAGERQLGSPSMGLTHNLGGVPYQGVAAISILGLH